MANTFTTAMDVTKPAGSRSKVLGDDDIREFKVQFCERFNIDHYQPQSEGGVDTIGFHRKATLVEQAADPSVEANAIILYGKLSGSYTELFAYHENEGPIQLTHLGRLNIAALDISGASQGDLIVGGASDFQRLAVGSAYNRLRVQSNGLDLEWTTQIRKTLVWFLPSSLSTGTRKSARIIVPFAGTIKKWRLDVGTAPTGANLIVDINKNGVTLAAAKFTITAGNSSNSGTSFDVTSVAVDDYFDIDLDQVGSTVAGSDLTVLLEVEPQ